jgi:hypothetical protein
MGIFEPVTLTWQGGEYTVPADRVLGLIASVEEHITLADLGRASTPKLAQLSYAYAAALRYAGARVTADEVYAACFRDTASTVQALITSLLIMMIPPSELQERMEKTADPGAEPSKKKGTARALKQPIKQSQRQDG